MDRLKVSGREMLKLGADMPRVVDVYNQRRWEGDLIAPLMCFTKNKYSEVLSLPNSERLTAYLTAILDGNTGCLQQDCEGCGHCRKYADLIQVDAAAKARWTTLFQSRIAAFVSAQEANGSLSTIS